MMCRYSIYNITLKEYPTIFPRKLSQYLIKIDIQPIIHLNSVLKKIMILNGWKSHEKLLLKCCCKEFIYHQELLYINTQNGYILLNNNLSCNIEDCFLC